MKLRLVIEAESFGRGCGWILWVGRLHFFWLARRVAWHWRPWICEHCFYWLRGAVELEPREAKAKEAKS